MVVVGWTGLCCPCGTGVEGKVSLTGGPHLDPVVLMSLADDILSPDAEAVVPRVPEGVGQVVCCAGHRHRVAFPFLQREALGLETPAHSQRRAAGTLEQCFVGFCFYFCFFVFLRWSLTLSPGWSTVA